MKKVKKICIAVGLVMIGCSGQRNIFRAENNIKIETATILERIADSRKEVKSFVVDKYICDLEYGEEKVRCKGYIRAIEDSAILVTANLAGGIEILRAFVTKDRIRIMNRMEKEIYDLRPNGINDVRLPEDPVDILWMFLLGRWEEEMDEISDYTVSPAMSKRDVKIHGKTDFEGKKYGVEMMVSVWSGKAQIKSIMLSDPVEQMNIYAEYGKTRRGERMPEWIKINWSGKNEPMRMKLVFTERSYNRDARMNFRYGEEYRIRYGLPIFMKKQ